MKWHSLITDVSEDKLKRKLENILSLAKLKHVNFGVCIKIRQQTNIYIKKERYKIWEGNTLNEGIVKRKKNPVNEDIRLGKINKGKVLNLMSPQEEQSRRGEK